MPDGRPQPRVGRWCEVAESSRDPTVEGIVEPLDPHDLHRRPTARVEREQRDPVAELVQRHGQRARGGALVVVHRPAGDAGLTGRARHVEQDEHGEVSPASKALHVEVVVVR